MRVATGADGRVVLARTVVVAAGTPATCAALLPTRPAAWDALGPPAEVACLDLGLPFVPETTVLFGVDRPLYLSRHAPPADLAPPGGSVVHVMRYLRAGEEWTAADGRADLEEHARLAGIDPDRAERARYLHRQVACPALPTPATGGLRGRPGVADTGLDGVLVAGDWVGPVGHLTDAALVSGEAAGRLAAERSASGIPVGGSWLTPQLTPPRRPARSGAPSWPSGRALVGLAYRITGSRLDAEDIVQEAWSAPSVSTSRPSPPRPPG